MRPLAIDLFTGLHGWAEGLIAEGWFVIGLDLEDMSKVCGVPKPSDFALLVQDVLTFHGAQARDAQLIVSSSPCTDYSYMAMPWTRAKAKAAAIRADETGESLRRLNALFDAQFRIQREACEAAGRHIPMVVENVRGAQPWVGRARWNFGSYYVWGDVPALMPAPAYRSATKAPGLGAGWVHPSDPRHTPGLDFTRVAARSVSDGRKNGDGGSWFGLNPDGSPGALNNARDGRKVPGFRFDGSGRSFQTASVEGMKIAGRPDRRRGETTVTPRLTSPSEGRQGGAKRVVVASRPPARKAASDPPWSFETYNGKHQTPHRDHRGAGDHYAVTETSALCDLPIAGLCAWPKVGMGYWTRKQTEQCWLFTRGKPRRLGKGVEQIIHCPRGAHSAKPQEQYGKIEALVGGPYLELFSRSAWPNWTAWGDQAGVRDGLFRGVVAA